MNILLDYFFPIESITPTPAASTAFLKQVLAVVKPAGSSPIEDTITLCTSKSAVNDLSNTNNDVDELFDAGMSRVYVLAIDDLGTLGDILEGHESDFYTVLISSDFTDAEIDLAAANGICTISSYANLLTTTPDTVTVAGVAFTAQSGAVTEGTATFQAATSNDATAASLAAQINAHATTSALVTATVVNAIVTVTANELGISGNDIGLSYTDNGGGNVGAVISGVTAGKLDGGAGLDVGAFTGVVGIASATDAKNTTRAATANWAAFHTTTGNKAKNMFYAFGTMLSNALDWKNQQYITMPYADDVATLGEAEALFDDKISFVISDTEFGNRLALFAQGSKAIVEPYIKRNLQIDMQSAALSYISGNQPAYTKVQAALLEDELQKIVLSYIDRQWIEAGTVEVKLEQSNFVASGYINIAEPKALWRIFGEMRETL